MNSCRYLWHLMYNGIMMVIHTVFFLGGMAGVNIFYSIFKCACETMQTTTLGSKLSSFNTVGGEGERGHWRGVCCSQPQFLKAEPARWTWKEGMEHPGH